MKKFILPSATAFFAISLISSSIAAGLDQTDAAVLKATFTPAPVKQAANRYIVQFKQTKTSILKATPSIAPSVFTQGKFSETSALNFAKNLGADVAKVMPSIGAVALLLDKDQIKTLSKDPQVDFVEVDPKRFLMAESQPYGISMVQANQLSDAQTGSMTVCIADTGYSLGHEDLPGSNLVTGDDNNGQGSDTGNWFEDGHGHGTHVSGTIAALGGNGKGVVGVNPNGQLKLHMIKVFDNAGNWAYGSDLVVAVSQCRSAGAKVISMSLGGGASSTAERNAFDSASNAGVLSIAAAGNDGNTAFSYPASYDSVVSVAAVDSSSNHASFSQRNSQVEIAAPGVAINSTLPGNTYASWNGTSMATPHVAGVAALVWSHFPGCSNEQIRDRLNDNAQDRGASGRDSSYGYGIIKAKDAYDDINANGCDGGSSTGGTSGAWNNLSAATGSWADNSVSLPSGVNNLTVTMSGGTGDADLYLNPGSFPTTTTYACRPYLVGNNESCSMSNPQSGTWWMSAYAYSAFSGVTVSYNYQ